MSINDRNVNLQYERERGNDFLFQFLPSFSFQNSALLFPSCVLYLFNKEEKSLKRVGKKFSCRL